MSKIKLKSRVSIPSSVGDLQKDYAGHVKGYSKAEAMAIFNKLKTKTSVNEAWSAYRKARRGLWRKAYFGKTKERFLDMKKDFKIKKAVDLLFTVIGFKVLPDYLASRRALRSKLDAIGYALSAEVARDPALRKALSVVAKDYPYMSVNSRGELFVSSYSGSIIDKGSLFGMALNPDNNIPSRLEIRSAKKAFGQRINLNLILKLGAPKFENAQMTQRAAGATKTTASKVVVANAGDKEVRLFVRASKGSKNPSTERVITSEEVAAKSITLGKKSGTKIVAIKMKDGEIINLELEAKQAESIMSALKD